MKQAKNRTERLGAVIRELRLERGLTLEQLAKQTQLSKSFLSYLEKGAKSIGVDALTRLLEALGAHADAVLEKAGYLTSAGGKQADLRTTLREHLGLHGADLDQAMSYLEFLASKNPKQRSKERRK